MRYPFRAAAVLLAALLAAGISTSAAAQYFGTNKVQYRTFQFQVLTTEHFDIYFYPAEREGAEIAARMAERWYTRLAGFFDHQLRGRQPIVLYASHVDFEQTNVVAGDVGEGTGGVTESLRRRIVLPLAGPLADTDHVLGHELVHAFQYDLASRGDGSDAGNPLEQLPLWFVEGMAEYLSLGPEDAHTAMWLRDMAQAETLPSIRDLAKSEYFPYRWGHAYWAYVAGRWGDRVVGAMLRTASQTGDTALAAEKVLGVKEKELSTAWQAAIRDTYLSSGGSPSTASSSLGRTVIRGSRFRGAVNVGPAVSPDGRWIAFLSERGVFSIDLFIADAETGIIVKKLTDTASSPHYASLQFIYSAGAWDAEGKRLAAATIVNGRPALAVFEWPSGTRQREAVIDGVDEIFNPTWSPDGTAVCFTGMQGGLTDLFVYDLETSSLRRLTHDAYSDIQPAWSPDGRRVAFATDRFSTDLDTLALGSPSVALIDPDTGTIERVPAFVVGKHINPQWSPDNASLYFISDRDGISNLYRVRLSDGEFEQITTAATGISGITASSPALSVAAAANLATVTVYEHGTYAIHVIRLDGAGGPLEPTIVSASTLPPVHRKGGEVAAYLADHGRGLPPVMTAYPAAPYRTRLSLENVAQTMIGVGVDRLGAAFGAGLGMTFSDMLNNHRLTTVVEFNSGITGGVSVRDAGVQVSYLNQSRRWNWGMVGGQIPYLSGGARTSLGRIDGELVQVDEVVLYQQIERAASGIVAYPFDRARRVEIQGGMSQVSFGQVIRTDAYSLVSGRRVFSDTSRTSLADTLTLATTSTAFVSDISQFGATSPVEGERYRLEVAPTFGTISFTSLSADYRRYVMPASFYTIAMRGLHHGRYGSDGEDVRLAPLYLGYPTLVRGYDVSSFNARECVATTESACPVFDRLLGSRVLVGNVEFRFPLLRPFGVSSRMYGPVPVEVGVFADGGVAWKKGETPSLTDTSRGGVASAGITFRVGLFGFAVGQFDIVRPFQRPAAGWVFQFNLAQGF